MMSTESKIGILGGTFNPIHNGHLQLASYAREYLKLDQVIFIPSGVSYMKKDVLDAKTRLYMTQLAISGYSYFSVSDIEQKRDGNSYTFETLDELQKMNSKAHFYFIIGADSLYAIEKWKNPDRIFEHCTLACTVRDKVTRQELEKQSNYLKKKYKAKIILLPMTCIDISSTDIRNAVQNKESISELVPASVAEYIERNHIYE